MSHLHIVRAGQAKPPAPLFAATSFGDRGLSVVRLGRTVEGVRLNLGGNLILPGLINAHDHLEFALFPRLGKGPYANSAAWARDIYKPEEPPISDHLRVPKPLRLIWGGLRSLASGVTTVSHHNPYDPIFDDDFPVRVVKQYGWAHSLAFSENLAKSVADTPPGAPFLIHAAEGIDEESAGDIAHLRDLGALTRRTVLIHCVGLDREGWRLVEESGASVIWCPRSNMFLLNRTIDLEAIPDKVPIALGTDSPLTAEGDLLDEISAAKLAGVHMGAIRAMVTDVARAVLRLGEQPQDWIAAPHFGAPPALVVVMGRIHLISDELAEQLPRPLRAEFFPLRVEGRPPVQVRWNVPRFLEETQRYLRGPIRLAGRQVSA